MSKVPDISASVDWKRLQTLVLTRMQANAATMTSQQKNVLTRFQEPDTMEELELSYDDQIAEVKALTELGKKIIVMTIRLMAKLYPTAMT